MKKPVDKRIKTFLLAVEKMRDAGKFPLDMAMALGTSETSIKVILSLLPKK